MMKVFVYSKKTSKKIAEVKHVVTVQPPTASNKIILITESGEMFTFDTKEVKTTIYQN